MCLTIGWWIWAGSPVGASETNDCGLGEKECENMRDLMDPRDLMITDRAFRPLREKLNILCGWNNSRTKQLSEWQKQENKELSQQRGKKILIFTYFRFL